MFRRFCAFACVTAASVGFTTVNVSAEDWLGFLGPGGSLKSTSTVPAPVEWSAEKNIKWQVDLPGKGVSSPIVVGDKVFVTSYSGYGVGGENEKIEDLKRNVTCVDRASGKELWTKSVAATLPEDPYSGIGVPAHGYASHTPVSDGEKLFVFFGKSGVIAYDLDGNQLWKKSVGTGSGQQRWGSASSPLVYKNMVIVPATEEAESIVALDKESGEEIWTSPAEDFRSTWGSPVIVDANGAVDLVISVPGEVWGLNPESGKLRWYSPGTTDTSASASVAVADGVIYATGGRSGDAVAVKSGGKKDVGDTNVVWEANIPGRFATPVIHEGNLYCFASGIVSVYDTETGDRVAQKRLSATSERGGGPGGEGGGRPGGFGGGDGGRPGGGGGRPSGGRGGMMSTDYASPVIADGKLYITMRSGRVSVLTASPELELLATNVFEGDSGFGGTPAVCDGALFIRSDRALYCVAKTAE